MKSSDSNPNKVLIAYSLIYMLPLSAKIPFNWRELTPVSVVAMDQFVLWDNAEGPKSGEGIRRRRQGGKLAVAGARFQARGPRADHVDGAEHPSKFSYLIQVRRRGGDAELISKSAHDPTWTTRAKKSRRRLGAPARCVGCWACSTRRAPSPTRPRSRRSQRGTTSQLQGGGPRRAVSDAARFLPGKVTPEPRVLCRDCFQKVAQGASQGAYGEAGAQADLPHRQGHAEKFLGKNV